MFHVRSVRRLEGGFAVVAAWLLVWWLAAEEAEAEASRQVAEAEVGRPVVVGFARE